MLNLMAALLLYWLIFLPSARGNLWRRFSLVAVKKGNWFDLVECKGYPWKEKLPDGKTILREFAVNKGWHKYNAQIVLLDDGVRVLDFFAKTSVEDENLFSSLLPQKMFLADRPPLFIDAQWESLIRMVWTENATESDIDVYTEMINQLPGTKEFFDWGATIEDVIFAVNDEGTLDLVECRKNK